MSCLVNCSLLLLLQLLLLVLLLSGCHADLTLLSVHFLEQLVSNSLLGRSVACSRSPGELT